MTTEPARVLRIIARMNVGGPALQVTALQRGLDPARFESRLLAGSVEEGEEDYIVLRAPDVSATTVAGLGRSIRLGDDGRALARLVREMRSFRPDIVHTHTAKAGVLGRIAARATGVPHVVHTFHGHLLHGYFRPSVTAAVVRVERLLARSTDRLVAVGAQVRDDLLAAGIGSPEQYVVVAPGVADPPRPTRDDARRQLGLPLGVPIIAFVARLTAVKRPERAIDVIEEVRRDMPEALLVVAGDGPLAPAMRASAAHLGDSVRFLGWREDVGTVYAACDVVLLTSENEGMPVSLIEAAVAGRPAVTTDVGSASEVVLHEETGIVVSRPEDLGSSTQRLLGDAAGSAELGAEARRSGLNRFGEARLVRDMASIYDELLGGPARPDPR